ncbi:uncharacterized protein LOC119105519 [Pollicipes pollicipes]|uniref:uncharacterized protein LOC119105519 n=1 Tax=Pollicipes pollicipes TaxID=41117 RepID=UPI0018857D3F|nr:uncharacterized protein LOC119105519 [Pollicipes pollicipes]
MPPRTERNVNVVFTPSGGQHERRDAAVIPLSGYGGASDVQIHVNARDPSGRPCLSLNAAGPGGTRLAGFSIANIGQRAAYIKLVVFSDMACERPLPAHQATVHPSQFILRPGDTRQLTAVVPPVAHAQDVGAVLVLSGDETLRQELRRRPPGAGPSHHTPANLRTINFQASYDGEAPDGQAAAALGASAARMEELFFSSMKQTKLPLKYMPARPLSVASEPKPHDFSSPYDPRARAGVYLHSAPGEVA